MLKSNSVQFIKMLFSAVVILHTIEVIFSIAMIVAGLFLSWLFYFNGSEYVALLVMGTLSIIAGATFAYRGLFGIIKMGNVNSVY